MRLLESQRAAGLTLSSVFDKRWLFRHNLVAHLKEAAHFTRGRLLDVGCGSKPYSTLFFPYVENYIGLDSPDISHETSISVEIFGDTLHLPFQPESFDTVLCTGVLDDIAEPRQAFKEMYRVLTRGGYLIMTAPNSQRFDPPYDYFRFSRNGLRYLAEQGGFRVEYIKAQGGLFSLIGVKLSLYIADYLGRGIMSFPAKLACAIVQLLFLLLDRLHTVEEETLNNTLVAVKAS